MPATLDISPVCEEPLRPIYDELAPDFDEAVAAAIADDLREQSSVTTAREVAVTTAVDPLYFLHRTASTCDSLAAQLRGDVRRAKEANLSLLEWLLVVLFSVAAFALGIIYVIRGKPKGHSMAWGALLVIVLEVSAITLSCGWPWP